MYNLNRATSKKSTVDLHFPSELTAHTDFVAYFHFFFLTRIKGFDATNVIKQVPVLKTSTNGDIISCIVTHIMK